MQIQITRTHLVVLAALAAAAGVYFLVDWLVVTDKERVAGAVDGLGRAVETNDAGALAPLLDPSFRLRGMNAAEFAPWYAAVLDRLKVKRVSLYDCTVELDAKDPDAASATVRTTVVLERPAGEHRIDWQLEFRRRSPTEWKLAGARAWEPFTGIEIPLRTVNDLLR